MRDALKAMKQSQIPLDFGKLSRYDQEEYRMLQNQISPLSKRNTESQCIASFKKIFSYIKQYAIRGDDADIIRQYVCGIFFIDDAIAVSTSQLITLLGKCKSSINRGMALLGYNLVSEDRCQEYIFKFHNMVPHLKQDVNLIRKWTIRVLTFPPIEVDPFAPYPLHELLNECNLGEEIAYPDYQICENNEDPDMILCEGFFEDENDNDFTRNNELL